MNYSATRNALVPYLRAGYTALTIYKDPPGDDLRTGDEVRGWVEMHWRPGVRGPEGGRMGPSATEYESPFSFTAKIRIPRQAGGSESAWDRAWLAADALEMLVLEAQVGDLSIQETLPRPNEVESGDTHVQIDLDVNGVLQAFLNRGDRAYEAGPVAEAIRERITLDAPHGLSVGQIVYRTETGLALAVASAEGTLAQGMVSAIHTDQTLDVTFSGLVRWVHGLGGPSTPAFLSPSVPGTAQTGEPAAGEWRQRLGMVWANPDEFLFLPAPGELL
jgi:hypothetical protein